MTISEKASSAVPHPPLQEYYAEEKHRRKFVSELFDKTAHNYDWVIKAMSFGSGNWYRNQALIRAGLEEGMDALDVATGTGPVAVSIKKIVGDSGSVIGLDSSINMLRQASSCVDMMLIQSDAGTLPFNDDSFNFLSMGYALRHVDDLNILFAEYFRVLKPGGKVLLMEFTAPSSKIGFVFTKFYMRQIVPLVARIGTRSKDSKVLMKYFWDTIEHCVRPNIILEAMSNAGFKDVKRHKVLGVFSEYTGVKNEDT